MRIAEQIADPTGVSFDRLVGVYDKCIIRVENEPLDLDFRDHIGDALRRVGNPAGPRRRGRVCGRQGPRAALHGRHRLRPRAAALPEGADPLRDPLPRPRGARDVPGHAHGARHRRPGHEGDPGGRAGHRHELPDERPVRRGVRALPRLHRRRDEPRPPRARAAGRDVEAVREDQLDVHGVRRSGAARAPRRWARSARTSSPGCTARS